ncbi:uncharacterized protein METZ01_LOCUS141877, partial [marine metagenome]
VLVQHTDFFTERSPDFLVALRPQNQRGQAKRRGQVRDAG